jgi:hypothetical protein
LKFKFNASATGYLGILFVLYAVVQAVVGFNNVPSEMERGFAGWLSREEAKSLWESLRWIHISIPSISLMAAGICLLFSHRILAILAVIIGYLGVGTATLLVDSKLDYWTIGAGAMKAPNGFIAYAWDEGFLIDHFGEYLWSWVWAINPAPFLVPLVIAPGAIALVWLSQRVINSVKAGFEEARAAEAQGAFAPNSGTSVAAMVLAIVIPWLGIVLAYVARNEIKRSQGKLGGARLVQLALVVGYSMVALQVIAGVIYAVVILLNLPK